jgi:hypothetical protein
MCAGEIREIHVPDPALGGKFVTLRVREKCRLVKDGVEGILFAVLDPNTLMEKAEYWAPMDSEEK